MAEPTLAALTSRTSTGDYYVDVDCTDGYDGLLLAIEWEDSDTLCTISSWTDDSGTPQAATFVRRVNTSAARPAGIEVWKVSSPAAVSSRWTPTWSHNPDAGCRTQAERITGCSANVVHANNAADGSGASATVGVTTTIPDCLLWEAFVSGNVAWNPSATGGQTTRENVQVGSGSTGIDTACSVISAASAGSYSISWSGSQSSAWGQVIVAIEPGDPPEPESPQVIDTPGSGTFVVPDGVYAIRVSGWGAGASGWGAFDYVGGGGGSAWYTRTIAVSPGDEIDYVVPSGLGPAYPATDGDDLLVYDDDDVLVLRVKGGKAALDTDPPTPGYGGDAAECVGDYGYSGGDGALSQWGESLDVYGGGGGAAGTDGPGGDASGSTGGTGGTGGGDGGSYPSTTAGEAPGGGGAVSFSGGFSGGGQLTIEWGDGIEPPGDDYALTAESGEIAVVGGAANLLRGLVLAAAAGVVGLGGSPANLSRGYSVQAQAGAVAVVGHDAALLRGRVLSADPGAIEISGHTATLTVGRAIQADAGAVEITGHPATFARGYGLAADAGAVAVAGGEVGFRRGYSVAAESGAVEVGGGAAGLLWGRALHADAGRVEITGHAVEFLRGYSLTAEAGSVAVSGGPSSLLVGRALAAETGTVEVVGYPATLTYSPVGNTTLVAGAGTVVVSGGVAALRVDRVLGGAAGAVEITGGAATLHRGWRLVAESGTVAVAGGAAALTRGLLLPAAAGAVGVVGHAVDLIHTPAGSYVLAAESGAVVVTGHAADLAWSGETAPVPFPRIRLFTSLSHSHGFASTVESHRLDVLARTHRLEDI